jgi:hypothetical protein
MRFFFLVCLVPFVTCFGGTDAISSAPAPEKLDCTGCVEVEKKLVYVECENDAGVTSSSALIRKTVNFTGNVVRPERAGKCPPGCTPTRRTIPDPRCLETAGGWRVTVSDEYVRVVIEKFRQLIQDPTAGCSSGYLVNMGRERSDNPSKRKIKKVCFKDTDELLSKIVPKDHVAAALFPYSEIEGYYSTMQANPEKSAQAGWVSPNGFSQNAGFAILTMTESTIDGVDQDGILYRIECHNKDECALSYQASIISVGRRLLRTWTGDFVKRWIGLGL